MKIVLDTNVYISAYLGKGLVSQILQLGHEEKVKLYISDDILDELKDKLTNKFKLEKRGLGVSLFSKDCN